MNNVEKAINRSIHYNEIVSIPFSEENKTLLIEECDDYVETDKCVEFWGNNGYEWRVHLNKNN